MYLFTSNINAKYSLKIRFRMYCSRCFYTKLIKSIIVCFSTLSIDYKVHNKIILEEAEAIVVVPLWKSQPWVPIFTKLFNKNPFHVDPSKNMDHLRNNHSLRQTLIYRTIIRKAYESRELPEAAIEVPTDILFK